jgi:flavin-dependent dehydrogenase
LARATSAGARFLRSALREARAHHGGWLVRDAGGGYYRSRWLVAADGGASTLRHQLAPDLQPGRYAARVAYAARGAPPGQAIVRFLPLSEGYAWDFPRPGMHSIGVALPAGIGRRPQMDGLIDELLAAGGEPGEAPRAGALIPAWDWTAGSPRELGAAGYAILGDAAGLADPVSGEGIDYALRSATIAATRFDERRGFSAYPAAVWRAFAPDRRRARVIRRWFYRPELIDRMVAAGSRSKRGAALLATLADAVNEHGPIGGAMRRARPGSLSGMAVR